MAVVLLLALIWAVVLVPPALRARAARREAFLVSFGPQPAPDATPPHRPHTSAVQRRRRIAGGLLVAMLVTLLMGLLPTFRVLLIVHLFVLDSFLAYIALLAHTAGRAARAATARPGLVAAPQEPVGVAAPARRTPRWRRVGEGGPAVLPDFGSMAPLA